MWVCNSNGNLENGDYICSAPVHGYGQLQSEQTLHNFTVAKITQDCDFHIDNSSLEYTHSQDTPNNIELDSYFEHTFSYDPNVSQLTRIRSYTCTKDVSCRT